MYFKSITIVLYSLVFLISVLGQPVTEKHGNDNQELEMETLGATTNDGDADEVTEGQQSDVGTSSTAAGVTETNAPQPIITKELVDDFNRQDLNRNGVISADELYAIMQADNYKHISIENAEEIIRTYDTDESGTIDLHEYAVMMQNSPDHKTSVEIFSSMDEDKNGFIKPAAITNYVRKHFETFSEETIKDIIKTMDVNEDGKISIKEFLAGLTKKKSSIQK